MCYSLGLFVWSAFVNNDGGPPLPPFVMNTTGVVAFVAALSTMGIFPMLSVQSLWIGLVESDRYGGRGRRGC